MSDLVPLVFLLCAISSNIGFFAGARFGEKNGANAARQETILLCVKNLQQCRVEYDHLKLQNKKQ